MDFSTIDITIFALYAVLILSIGLYVSRQKMERPKAPRIIF
jgi:Na+/proline symporter